MNTANDFDRLAKAIRSREVIEPNMIQGFISCLARHVSGMSDQEVDAAAKPGAGRVAGNTLDAVVRTVSSCLAVSRDFSVARTKTGVKAKLVRGLVSLAQPIRRHVIVAQGSNGWEPVAVSHETKLAGREAAVRALENHLIVSSEQHNGLILIARSDRRGSQVVVAKDVRIVDEKTAIDLIRASVNESQARLCIGRLQAMVDSLQAQVESFAFPERPSLEEMAAELEKAQQQDAGENATADLAASTAERRREENGIHEHTQHLTAGGVYCSKRPDAMHESYIETFEPSEAEIASLERDRARSRITQKDLGQMIPAYRRQTDGSVFMSAGPGEGHSRFAERIGINDIHLIRNPYGEGRGTLGPWSIQGYDFGLVGTDGKFWTPQELDKHFAEAVSRAYVDEPSETVVPAVRRHLSV